MGNLLINIFGVFLLIMAAYYLYLRLHPHAFDRQLEKQAAAAREKQKKGDSERIGKRIIVPRDGLEGVAVNLYKPHGIAKESYPAVFIAHGGSFMDGDADQLDTFCERAADQWESVIISINYATIDVHQIPYPQEEIRDTVMYFAIHASEFSLDAKKFAMMGFTAGAYLMVGACTFLKEKGFPVKGLIMVSPFVDDTQIRLCDIGAHVSPAVLVQTGTDAMKDRYPVYIEHMKTGGVDLTERTYEDAVQGFMEYNNPEFAGDPMYQKTGAISDEQENLARACEIWLGSILSDWFEKE